MKKNRKKSWKRPNPRIKPKKSRKTRLKTSWDQIRREGWSRIKRLGSLFLGVLIAFKWGLETISAYAQADPVIQKVIFLGLQKCHILINLLPP